MSDLMLSGTAYAFAEWGIWKAKCPRPGCTNAMALEVDQPVFVCLGLHSCGIETPIAWPADPDAVEALLAMRPLAINRNWLPNESLEDLLAENAAHDCIPPEWMALAEASPGGVLELLGTTDGVITSGLLLEALPAGRPRPAIGA
jgi:hypothetical protein